MSTFLRYCAFRLTGIKFGDASLLRDADLLVDRECKRGSSQVFSPPPPWSLLWSLVWMEMMAGQCDPWQLYPKAPCTLVRSLLAQDDILLMTVTWKEWPFLKHESYLYHNSSPYICWHKYRKQLALLRRRVIHTCLTPWGYTEGIHQLFLFSNSCGAWCQGHIVRRALELLLVLTISAAPSVLEADEDKRTNRTPKGKRSLCSLVQ